MINTEKIQSLLKSEFGFTHLRGDQERAIHSVIEGHDTMVIMPTGGGKSLCYQLPALYFDGITVVLSPLISLMKDQVDNLDQMGIKSAFLNSSQDFDEKKVIIDQLRRGEVKILYMAPEGILSDWNISLLKELNVSLIAVDEAHCVSQWGHEFRHDYARLGELKTYFTKIPFLALTATADEKTRSDIKNQLKLNEPNIFISGFDRPNIKYMVYERLNEIQQLHKFIQEQHLDDVGIVYCLSRNKTEKVAEELVALGLRAIPYHAGMTPKQREKAQRRFKTEDSIIVVATIAFGMGIDRPDVRFVAHLDLPKSIEGYYQETGRAGRDGEPSNAWMIYGLTDVVKLARMIESGEASENYKKVSRLKLESMLAYCESLNCRRQVLLDYFGESASLPCGNCDACIEPQKTFDATVASQKILSTIYRTGQMYGANYVIDVLRGSQNQKILQSKHNELSVFGIGKDYSKSQWNSILRQLLTEGYLCIKNWEYRSLGLTEKSRPLLRGEIQVQLREIGRIKSASPKKEKSNRTDLPHNRPELFEKLRQLRMELAKENSVPPYIIFSDKSLNDMCHLLPRDKDQMLLVQGVGETKFERYGEQFLQAISLHNL